MKFLSVSCCAVLALSVHGQVTFQRTVETPWPATITGSHATFDGGLVLCGHSTFGLCSEGVLVRLDAAGNTLWAQKQTGQSVQIGFGDPAEYVFYEGVVQLPDSSFLVVGSVSDSGMFMIYNREFLAARFGPLGDTLGANVDGGVHPEYYTDAFLLANGQPAAFGNYRTLSYGHGLLATLNPAQWVQIAGITPNTPVDNTITSAAPAINGGAVAVAGRAFDDSTIYLFGVDGNMAVQWETAFTSPDVQHIAEGVVCTAPSGAVYHAAGTDTLLVSQLSSVGTPAWSRTMVLPGPATVGAMTANPDNSVTLAGTCALAPDTVVLWMATFDAGGTLQWLRRYGAPGDVLALRGLEAPLSGGYYLVASDAEGATRVLRTDDTGQLPSCTFPALSAIVGVITLMPTTSPGYYNASLSPSPIRFEPIPVSQYAANSLSCLGGIGGMIATGTPFIDTDADGALDPGEPELPWTGITISPGSALLFTNSDGAYAMVATTIGTYTATAALPAPWWSLTAGAAGHTFTFTAVDTLFEELHFGFVPAFDTTVVEAQLISQQARCLGPFTAGVRLTNMGSNTPTGVIALTLDADLNMSSSSLPPDSVVGGVAYWSYGPVGYYTQWQLDLVLANGGGLGAGDTATSSLNAYVYDGFGNLIPADSMTVSSAVLCSYDPNDKSVDPLGEGSYHGIAHDTEWLTYTIRFQNTGNDTAYTVMIEDQLDADLQWSTLQYLGSSHDLTSLSIGAMGKATFTFNNILLPDSNTNEPASHGFVTYRIAPQPGLPHLALIENNAGIFFDLNAPVITNTVANRVINCGAATPWPIWVMNFGNDLYAGTSTSDTLTYTYQWYLNGQPLAGATGSFGSGGQASWSASASGDYTIELVDQFGCTSVSAPFAQVFLAAGTDTAPSFVVVPNPMDGNARLISSAAFGVGTNVELVDVHGRVVRTMRGSGSREVLIEGGDLAAGVYSVRVLNADGRAFSSRLVVR